MPMGNTKDKHSRYMLQTQKILQLIVGMITVPDFAGEHSDDTSCVCAWHAATNLKSRVDSTFRIEVMGIHRLRRLDHDPLQVVGGTQEFTHRRHELSNEYVHQALHFEVRWPATRVKTPNIGTVVIGKAIPGANASAIAAVA